ncbi:MAG: dual specificity protein phosphatase [Candidatus Eremiobacteraeota bacterium]|nr:dual specificity protein phosphatase [Candidatus Eremiobacteraeota bacterium]
MSADPTRIDIRFDPRHYRMSGIAVHGNTPFDVPFISEIAENLWQGGCEEGLVLPDFIVAVVSLYPWEKYRITNGAVRHEIEMYDSTEQAFDQVDELAALVNQHRKSGPVLVHCQAGLNRSSLIAARALMLEGMSADAAITTLREKRSQACLCNKSFERWLRSDRPC